MQTTNPQENDASKEGDNPEPIKGHSYDGILEYDNPMPGWWVWLFIGTVVFSVVYFLGIQFGYIDTYEEDLAEGMQDLENIRAQFAASAPAFVVDEETLEGYIGDAAKIEAGSAHFAAQCVACHGAEGQGLIGPNLTDRYWKAGGSNLDIYTAISQGALEKGMPPWEGVFSPEQRAELVAFIRSIEGTNPPNARAQEGELYEGS